MMRTKNFKRLKGIVIGRSDLAGSLNLQKSEVDSKKIFKLVLNLLKKIKRKKIIIKMGGSLTTKSLDFANKLYKNNSCAAPTIKTAIVINLFKSKVEVSMYGLS